MLSSLQRVASVAILLGSFCEGAQAAESAFRSEIVSAGTEYSVETSGLAASRLFSAKMFVDAGAIRAFRSLSSDEDAFVRAVAMWALAIRDPAAHDVISRALDDQRGEIRVQAARILIEVYSGEPNSVGRALRVAKREKQVGSDDLLLYLEMKSIPRSEADVQAVLESLSDADPKIRHVSLAIASRTERDPRDRGAALSRALADPRWTVSDRAVICHALGRILRQSDLDATSLVEQIGHADVRVRIAAEKAMGCSSRKDNRMVTRLVQRLDASDPKELIAVCYALSRLAPGDPSSMEALNKLQAHSDIEVRRWATYAADPTFSEKEELVVQRPGAALCVSKRERLVLRIPEPSVDEGSFAVTCQFATVGARREDFVRSNLRVTVVGRMGERVALHVHAPQLRDQFEQIHNQTVSFRGALPEMFSPQEMRIEMGKAHFEVTLPFRDGEVVEDDLFPSLAVDAHCY